jgi:ABC-type multidrug transport system ATPase subunit
VTTHYMSEAEYCDRLALMHGGKLIADATPEALKRDVETVAGQIIEITADRSESALKILKRGGFGTPSFFGRKLHILSLDPAVDGVRATEVLTREGIRVSSVNTLPLSMEDVFVYRIESLEQEAVEAEVQG